eukprot:3171707-Heterocapsa_arctica.AAC.1
MEDPGAPERGIRMQARQSNAPQEGTEEGTRRGGSGKVTQEPRTITTVYNKKRPAGRQDGGVPRDRQVRIRKQESGIGRAA